MSSLFFFSAFLTFVLYVRFLAGSFKDKKSLFRSKNKVKTYGRFGSAANLTPRIEGPYGLFHEFSQLKPALVAFLP